MSSCLSLLWPNVLQKQLKGECNDFVHGFTGVVRLGWWWWGLVEQLLHSGKEANSESPGSAAFWASSLLGIVPPHSE